MPSNLYGSAAGKFGWPDFLNTLGHAAIVGAAAGITALSQWAASTDFGWVTPFVTTALAAAGVAIQKYLTDTRV